MLEKTLMTLLMAFCLNTASIAQTDSTDLNLYLSDAVLETALDSMLYGESNFSQLRLDFAVTDTLAFNKVHISLMERNSSSLIFKHIYSLLELQTASLITGWDVSLPFGNLENNIGYTVEIIIEDYEGSLGTTLTKTINP